MILPAASVALSARLGKTCSPLVFGCAYLGSSWPSRRVAREAQLFTWLDQVYAAGVNTFDTAHLYGLGASERTLGGWCRRTGLREQLVVATKGCLPHPGARHRINAKALRADLGSSLGRLGMDYVDIYFLHRDDPSMPVSEIIEICHEQMKDGSVRLFGVSNWTHERIEEANLYAEARGLRKIELSSPHFSLAWWRRAPYSSSVSLAGPAGVAGRSWYMEHQLPVFAWASMAQGFFSDRARSAFVKESLSPIAWQRRRAYDHPENVARRERARILGERLGLSTAQVALAYLRAQRFPVFPIAGMTRRRSLEQSVQALSVRLMDAEVRWLEQGDGTASP